MFIVGNDISKWQGTVNWDTYKNNSNFVIIRSSYGVGYTDEQFKRNQSEARRVGIPIGYYHYCYPQYNSPEAEADWFLKVIGDIHDGEVLCLDFEEHYAGDKVDWCKKFLDRVSSKLDGYKPLIYLNQSLATANDWKPVVDAGYGLWIAAYTYDPNNNNFSIGAWKFAAIQQWTNKQSVPGIAGTCDGDVFFGDAATFNKYGYHKPIIDISTPNQDNNTTDGNNGTSSEEPAPQNPPATPQPPTEPSQNTDGNDSGPSSTGDNQVPQPAGNGSSDVPVNTGADSGDGLNPPPTNQEQTDQTNLLNALAAIWLKIKDFLRKYKLI